MFRGIVARANYLIQDRTDVQYATKELSRRMAKPRIKDVHKAKRLARYLKGRERMISKLEYQKCDWQINAWVDTDYAGCAETRKSTSGGLLRLGKHTMKAWSNTQSVIALSSGEAEYYGLVKGASQAMGLRSLAADLGIDLSICLKTDSSAAKGIASRNGLGKVRHVEVAQLWVQEKVRNGEISQEKVDGKDNLADALTKYLGREDLERHIRLTGQTIVQGRHELNPESV